MRRLLLSGVLVFLPIVVRATVLIPIEFRELTTVSDVIVHGRVTDAHGQWTDGRRGVETLVTVDVSDYLKGNLGPTFTIHVPGGQLGRYRTIFVGAPEFRAGDEVVLFLRRLLPPQGAAYAIVGLSQGAFRVVPDVQSGRPTVVSPIVMSISPEAPEAVVRGDSHRKPVALDAFRDAVRQVLSGAAR
jgi:hypothetical protein